MSAVRTIVVGCGEPKKSMGWFHLQQLAVNPKAELLAVVEPWCAQIRRTAHPIGAVAHGDSILKPAVPLVRRFLGGGAGSRGAAEFEAMRTELGRTHPGCKFYASVDEVNPPA